MYPPRVWKRLTRVGIEPKDKRERKIESHARKRFNTPVVQAMREVCLGQPQLRSENAFRVGKVVCKGEDLQLLLQPKVVAPDGSERILSVLVDSGAEANLIRLGLFEKMLKPAKSPVRLAAVNGTTLDGGNEEITLKRYFDAVLRDGGEEKK